MPFFMRNHPFCIFIRNKKNIYLVFNTFLCSDTKDSEKQTTIECNELINKYLQIQY